MARLKMYWCILKSYTVGNTCKNRLELCYNLYKIVMDVGRDFPNPHIATSARRPVIKLPGVSQKCLTSNNHILRSVCLLSDSVIYLTAISTGSRIG